MSEAPLRVLASTLLVIWPTRILVGNYLSNTHLAEDAAEREIVILTHLALINDPDIKENAELKDDTLPHALRTLFRHTSDGIVKDDALPTSALIDIATKSSS